MNYIYDIVLNYCDDFERREFYEWNKLDVLTYIKKIPIIKVNDIQMKEIIVNKIKISSELLNSIKNKTNTEKGTITYSLLVGSIDRVVALKFREDGIIYKRSYLLLDEEEAVIEEISNFDLEILDYEIISKYEYDNSLTRKERSIKRYLLKELEYLYNNKVYDEIDYLYNELFDLKINIHKKYNFLISDISNNFSDKYIKIYNIIKMCKEGKV